jgi:hypothetical protein
MNLENQKAGVYNPRLDPLAIARVIGSLIFGATIYKMPYAEVDLDAYRQVCEAMLNGTFSTRAKRRQNKIN